ncbi:hypothetical protein DFJ58DRAFT_781098, partial [Suillus subalutaceus]|uniref:uncharacterized protein n=1 Tax=Suillus subalutaceus TaxID=48586 RepID=UPI001B87EEB7
PDFQIDCGNVLCQRLYQHSIYYCVLHYYLGASIYRLRFRPHFCTPECFRLRRLCAFLACWMRLYVRHPPLTIYAIILIIMTRSIILTITLRSLPLLRCFVLGC